MEYYYSWGIRIANTSATSGKLLGQPEPPPKEHINAVTSRGGKSTQDPPHPRNAEQEQVTDAEPEEEEQVVTPGFRGKTEC